MSPQFTDRILVPIANEEDAERTCRSIRHYFGDEPRNEMPTILVTHVIEKGGGTLDKAPLEARKEQAESIFTIARGTLEPDGYDVKTELRYGTDVVETLHDTVSDTDAESIAFVPQDGGLLVTLLSGNQMDLVRESPVPVITLPEVDVG